jgi:DNA-binding Lrp family transcriptional regulator
MASRSTQTALKTEVVKIADHYRQVWRTAKQMDATTVRILKAIQKLGPRNLLAVSRYTRIPFSSVYNRVGKMEAASGPIEYTLPNASKLGLMTFFVSTSAKPGMEEKVTQALKIPGYWRTVVSCEGAYSHFSFHYVPFEQAKAFQQYFKGIVSVGLASKSSVIIIGDYLTNDVNYDYYDPVRKLWKFPWDKWLNSLMKRKPTRTIEDPESYKVLVDKKDLALIKELQIDAREKFVDLAKPLGITLQAVKYRYDKKLVKNKILGSSGLTIHPYPREIAAYYQIFCEFASAQKMNRFYSYFNELFFIVGRSKVLKRNALVLRVAMLESQVSNLYRFLSELCKRNILTSYSALRLRDDTRERQVIPIELFDDKTGWRFDYDKCMSALKRLA